MAAMLLVACDPTAAVDAGIERDAGSDASAVVLCERAADCGAEFCVTWRCAPGHERADARGCVDEGSRCGAGEVCDEISAECRACADGADGDGDGHDALECGGDDCDDADESRFAGNPEVCDAEGHDEDCDPATLGEVDADGDGFISAACCNDDVCGDDCDDTVRALSPASTEECNTFDDNCNGEVDEAGAFCPIGSCVDSRCTGLGWERVFGRPAGANAAMNLAMAVDEGGAVYFSVSILADEDLDDDGNPEPPGSYLIAYEADGRVRWIEPVTDGPFRMAADRNTLALFSGTNDTLELRSTRDATVIGASALSPPTGWGEGSTLRVIDAAWAAGSLFAAVRAQPSADVTGPHGILLLRFDSDGAESARRLIHVEGAQQAVEAIAASPVGLAIVATSDVDLDLGGGVGIVARVSGARRSPFLVRLDHDFNAVWAQDQLPLVGDISISHSGDIAMTGSSGDGYAPFWGGAPWGPDLGFVLKLDIDGNYQWHRQFLGLFPFAVDYDERGLLMTSGYFVGTIEVPPRGNLTATASADAFFIAFDSEDGFIRDAREFPGSQLERVLQTAADSFGNLVLFGYFTTDISLPLGRYEVTTPSLTSPGLFLLKLADL